MSKPNFDLVAAHRFFASDCFNQTWDFIDKTDRSAEDDQKMLQCAFASLWHWTQRGDCSDTSLSVGNWQISRIYSLLDEAVNAAVYADRALACSQHLPPFYRGYAHEALARAAMVEGHAERAAHHLREAFALAAQITDMGERSTLEKDLETLR